MPFATYDSVILATTGLIGYWPLQDPANPAYEFADATGGTTAQATNETGYAAPPDVLFQTPGIPGVSCEIHQSITLLGLKETYQNSAFRCPPQARGAVELWWRRTVGGAFSMFALSSIDPLLLPSYGLRLGIGGTNAELSKFDVDPITLLPTYTTDFGAGVVPASLDWRYVVVTWGAAASVDLYVDAALCLSAPWLPASLTGCSTMWGRRSKVPPVGWPTPADPFDTGGQYITLQGNLSFLALYDQPLDAATIAAHYAAAFTCPPAAGARSRVWDIE